VPQAKDDGPMMLVDVAIDEQYVVADMTVLIAVAVWIGVWKCQSGSLVDVKHVLLTECTVDTIVAGVK
jgi:hypothetical protein